MPTTGHPVATLKTQRFYLSKRRRTAYVTLAVSRYLATGSSNHRMVAPSNATAEISSQHSKMLTNTCHFFIYPCISTPAASSNHSKRNYCQQITMCHAYVISTDSKFTSLELQ
ncbi:Cyclic nucleotide-gated ion channel [Dorcoceras hygrometricum]|uniref:Cyclic nucleotide-gated ion channel n=1 Tax=Dorcoceras hygrometricum TaxID=472368 RepID=A0A2Z7B212_9LAMI|nr:Cyclic nucleotide-gated ion channel [Dorcoceras hygrometricum]